MKLATLKTNHRDGELIVVNRALTHAASAKEISPTLQYAIENWDEVFEQLDAMYKALNQGEQPGAFSFDTNKCHSPLPRAYQWADGSAYVNHVELVRKARGAEMPENFWTDPLVYQGGSDHFLAPNEDILVESTDYGIDYEAEIAVITDDVPMAINASKASNHIKLLMLVNDVSLRNLIPNEIGKGFGFFQSKPSSSFSPVAITPCELGASWSDNKVHLPLISHINGEKMGAPNAGVDMTFDFATLISHVAKTRPLSAGTIIGSGTVSNTDRSKGSSCLAEKRMLEIIEKGKPETPFMSFGDTIQIEMFNEQGENIFGTISQTVKAYKPKD